MSENTDTATIYASQKLDWMFEVTREHVVKFVNDKELYEQDYDAYEVHFDNLLNTKYREYVTQWADEAETTYADYDDIPDELLLEAVELWAKDMSMSDLLNLIGEEWMDDFVESAGFSTNPNDATCGSSIDWEY